MLSEEEKVILKVVGKKIVESKDDAIDIVVNVVATGLDSDTSLEFAGILCLAEGIFNTLIWRASPSVQFYCDLLRSATDGGPRYHREMMETFGWV